ncbi:uracil-DNA glycosylase [Patulibacter sp. SYSU D01012]|uniref:uracil-DNA glycosylase n=1 Tax=Patulibacter sp. SYSU D01012 TaxID=2817381 RepID=UPI001B3052B6
MTSPTASERRARLAEEQERARGCPRCAALVAHRTTVVFGAGDPDADLLLVAESPGPGEDRQGLPLVGGAGRLLTELLDGIGLRREEVYVTTALKCRPPDNRDPLPEELAHCRPYLHAQLELVRPKVVATLGSFATKLLRGDPAGIKEVHGRAEVRTIGPRTVRLLPLDHPSAALYARPAMDRLRADVARIPALLALPAPEQVAPVPTDAAPAPPAPAAEPDPVAGPEQLGLF